MSTEPQPLSAARHIWSATWRFTVASLAAFSFWAFGGKLLKPLGAVGLDLVCAVIFIVLGSVLLHPLIKCRITFKNFCIAFTLAFSAYVAVWLASWYGIKGKLGEWTHSIVGPIALAMLLLRQTRTHHASIALLLAVVALHSLGYFAGDSLYAWVKSPAGVEMFSSLSKSERFKLAAMSWGLAYGLGLGSALGLILHQIAAQPPKTEPPAAE